MRIFLVVIACVFLLGNFTAHAEAPAQLSPLDANALRGELDSLEGRVVLVNFWATWCRPCVKEIPILVKLQTELKPKGFSLVAVSLDETDSDDAYIKDFIDQRFPDFSSYRSVERDKDSIVRVIDPAWNDILPTTYLLARDGSVAKRIQGSLTYEEFEQELLKLLE